MKHKMLKLLSLILAVIMTVQLIPQSVFSAAAQSISEALEEETIIYENNGQEIETENEKELTVIGEDKSRREANVKHYIMSDGSMMAVSYSQDVHYEENGEWIDIDNSLSEEDANDSEDYDGYSNKSNSFNVKFAKKADKQKLVTITQDKYSLSWGYNAKDSKNKSVKSKLKEKIKLESGSPYEELVEKTGSDRVVYENVDKNISLEYSLIGNSLKENIIVNEKADEYSFSFTIKTKNVYLEMNEEAGITVFAEDTKEEVFSIPAPFMYDAADNYSTAVEYSLQHSGNKEYTFTVTADAEWINNEETVLPVTIDPYITTTQSPEAITSTFIFSGTNESDYDNVWDFGSVFVGTSARGYKIRRALLKFDLPSLKKGDMVVDANLNLLQIKTSFYTSSIPDQQIDMHMMTTDWAENVTWDAITNADFSSVIYDYIHISHNDGDTNIDRHFDITKAVKEWYEGKKTNYGIMLKKHYEEKENESTETAYAQFYVEDNVNSSLFPVIEINYRNNKGLEDYWTYTTVSVEDAGTAYINDYTGNLVYSIPLAGISSELGSLGIEIVYNGYAAGTKFVAGNNTNVKTSVGKGCVLNVFQTVRESTDYDLTGDAAEDYPYVYMDGDGTEHYFVKDGTKYVDEDGLGLTLVPGGTGDWKYYIKNDTNTRYYFNQSGNLYQIKNSNGIVTFSATYDNNGTRMKTVTDAAGHIYTFSYDSNNYLTKITDPSQRNITIDYTNGKLSKVTFPYDTTNSSSKREIKYTYDSENCLTKATASSGYAVQFSYTKPEQGKRVKTVTEYGGSIEGQKIEFDRTLYNTTKIQTSGADGVYGNNNDLITTYQFDNFGRTVSQRIRTKGGSDYGAGVYQYTELKETDSLKKLNKISSSAGLGKNVVNQLKGINGESISSWTQYVSKADISTATSSSYRYVGLKSLAVTVNEITDSGGYGILGQSVDTSLLTLGSTYTFSAYVKCKDITKVYESSRTGAYLWIKITDADGNQSNSYSPVLTSASTLSENGWRRLSVSAVIPENATKVMAYLVLKNATGTAYFDCIQFELGTVANTCNLIENAGFERLSSDFPTSWSTSASACYSSDSKYHGKTHSLEIQGDTLAKKQVYQIVALYGDKDDTYILSGWGRADAVSSKHHNNAAFELGVVVSYTTADGESFTEIKTPAKFNTTVSGWQYTSVAIPIASKKNQDATPKSMTIYCRYAYQPNNAYFDNIQLIKDVAQTYFYDADGNATVISSNSEQTTNLEYHEDNKVDLISSTDALGNKYSYTYDNNHNLQTVTSPRGIETVYGYTQNKKLPASTLLQNSSGTIKMLTETEYMNSSGGIAAGAYITKTIDSNKKTTTYSYDTTKGLLKNVTNANGQTTTYKHYIQSDRLASVESDGTKVTYDYDGNKLSTITVAKGSKSENYSFVYDAFGNVISTKVDSTELITNTYKANNGLLASSLYGNGDKVAYTYNTLGLVNSVLQNGYTKYKWSYNNAGVPMLHQDLVNNEKYLYIYDSIGRLIMQEIQTNDTSSHIGSTGFSYDKRNNLSRIYLEFGGKSVTQQYKYSAVDENSSSASYAKDNLPTQYYISSTRHLTYSYNSINQLAKKALSTTSPIYYNYRYVRSARNAEGDETYRTNLLERETIDNTTYNYTYDDIGNITKITKGERYTQDNPDSFGTRNNKEYRSYTYDSLNQLTREINATTNKSTDFTYDGIGNITKKTERAYTEGSLGPVIKEIAYTYSKNGKNGWNNLLTSVDLDGDKTVDTNEIISYDEIGNPTSYLGNTLTWYGRQLKKYVGNGNTITYTYDADGYRATKTVNGDETIYRYVNGQLVYEEKPDGRQLFYLYDSYGYLTAIRYYNGDTSTLVGYYVTTNAQGDVIGIYNADGVLRATYEYDAWGNIIAIKNGDGDTVTSSTHIAMLNSVRYRSYCYDNETGLYYVSSRYYDPEIGRFINADNIAYLGMGGLTSYNLFAYCGNNPVMGYDPYGTFDWSSFGKGAGWLAIGITAICVGVSVLTCGVAAPAMMAVAAVTVTAGALTTVNGVSELGEAATGHNFVRDDVFRGNEKAYDVYSNTTAAVAEIGTAICGGWTAKNAPRIKAYNNIQNYNYTDTISDVTHMSRPYANSVLTQKQVIKYGKMTKDSFGYVFSAMGSVNGKEKLWRLGINTAKGLVWHWGHGF